MIDHKLTSFLSVLVLLGVACAQRPEEPFSHPITPLHLESSVTVPLISSPAVALPVSCAADGTIYLRLFSTQSGVQEITGIHPDGSTVRFTKTSVIDIPNATLGSHFATRSRLYVRVRGLSDPRPAHIRTPFSTTPKATQVYGRSSFALARFKSDGSYDGFIPLDVPVIPSQIGVFEDGMLLIGGVLPDASEHRIVLANSDGTFNRFLHLDDNITSAQSHNGDSQKEERSFPWIGSSESATEDSIIVPDGDNLVLAHRGKSGPIYVITPGGAVDQFPLKVPKGYSLFSLLPTPRNWIVQFAYSAGDQGLRFVTFAIDRSTGEIVNAFSYPTQLGLGLACADEKKMVFVTKGNEGGFNLLHAAPGAGPPLLKEPPLFRK